MTRPISAAAIAMFIAAPSAYASETFSDSLHQMVLDNKIVCVEVELMELDMSLNQADYTVDAELRAVYAQFETTDPAIGSFIDDWNTAYPNSLYAKVAKAAYLGHADKTVQAAPYVSMTFVSAYETVAQDVHGSTDIVWKAYAERPDFAPVSDLARSLIRTE